MIITVNSYDEAKTYPVLFGQSELLMDNNEDIFYLKNVDAMGKATVDAYRFEKIEIKPETFVTTEQFNALNVKIDSLMEMLGGRNEQYHKRKEKSEHDGGTNEVR